MAALDDTGRHMVAKMEAESAGWKPEELPAIFGQDIPAGSRISHDRSGDHEVITDLLNMGWMCYRIEPPTGSEMYAYTTQYRETIMRDPEVLAWMKKRKRFEKRRA
jgi:hypothetical protein